MRNKIKLILLFLILGFNSFSHENKQPEKIKIEVLNAKLDSVIKTQKNFKNTVLKERIEQATETISHQNSIISSFGTLYSVITIIFAILGIALPILIYLFGIRPSQKALKDFEENSVKKFEKFIEENKKSEIDIAITNIKSQNNSIKNSAINFLSLNSHFGLDGNQIFKILSILNEKDLDDNLSNELNHCISHQKNENVKKYFEEFLLDSKELNTKFYYCMKFFSNYNYETYKELLKEYITNNIEKNQSILITISIYFSQFSKSDFKKFINDESIIDSFDDDTKKHINQTYKSFLSTWKIEDKDFKKTYLFQKINTYN